ncbi:uncharacterized protein LOC120119759 isoform X2 [Hibiscus syriacus]|uniref:uncharacterized protein LOC120119759 isoform X2 n=1 Tax=Hibiscus syriacus TaxID=106335 RepID=UPI001924ED18|nr:uncharacterized protein LOC120119759 isoform X2 [Hibiscus syriacus]
MSFMESLISDYVITSWQRISGESESSSESSKSEADESADKSKQLLRKGDRVKYIGPNVQSEASKRIILGEVSTPDGSTNVYTSIRGRWVGPYVVVIVARYMR